MFTIAHSDLQMNMDIIVFKAYMKNRWNLSNLQIFTCGITQEILLWVNSKQFYGPFTDETVCKEWILENVK